MSRLTIPKVLKSAQIVIDKNAPELLTTVAVTGTITTALMAGKAAIEADHILQKQPDNLPFKEEFKLVWHCYIPPVISGLATIGFIIGLNQVHSRRNAALMGLYSIAQTAFAEYKDKVIETIGENKERKVREDIDADTVRNNPVGEVIITGCGDVLCFDKLSGRYFHSDIETIRQKINELNRSLLTDMFISLNDFYYELGLAPIDLGYEVGFNIDKSLLKVNFTSQLTKDGKPCLVLNYEVTHR